MTKTLKVLISLIMILLIVTTSIAALDEPRIPAAQAGDDEPFEITVGEARLALYYKELAIYRADLIRELEPALRFNTMMLEETEKENRWLKVTAVSVPLLMLAAFMLHERKESK